jgi:type 1 glutamine amidotransferase
VADPARTRLNAVLIAGGKYHDIDYARLQLLTLLGGDDRVRVRVFEDYSNLEAIRAADFLVSYTCDVTPSLPQQEALRTWLEAGGRWYALHGTNSILRFLAEGVDSPRWAPHFMRTLGSMFIADPSHPLVAGVTPFQAQDELYLSEYYGELKVLLETEFEGEATGFIEHTWPKAKHPVFYLHPVGAGEVLYLTLGHCRGHYDMQPMIAFYEVPEKGSWALPVFHDLLARGVEWAKQPAIERARAAA